MNSEPSAALAAFSGGTPPPLFLALTGPASEAAPFAFLSSDLAGRSRSFEVMISKVPSRSLELCASGRVAPGFRGLRRRRGGRGGSRGRRRRSVLLLQRAQVHHDRPAVLGGDLRAVGGHVANTVRDRVEQLPDGLRLDVRLVHVSGRNPGHTATTAALDQRLGATGDHAVTVAEQAVARSAVDAEALLAALDRLLRERQLEREGPRELAFDLAAEIVVVFAQIADRDRACHRLALRAGVGEHGVLALRLVLRLPVHVADQMDARITRPRVPSLGG